MWTNFNNSFTGPQYLYLHHSAARNDSLGVGLTKHEQPCVAVVTVTRRLP